MKSGGKETRFAGTALLTNDQSIPLSPKLAAAVGVNEALVLQQVHFLLGLKAGGKVIKGTRWIWNTVQEWRRRYFPFLSVRTLERVITGLERKHLLLSCQPDGHLSRKKYYRVNYPALNTFLCESAKLTESEPVSLAGWESVSTAGSITESTSENTCTDSTRNEGTSTARQRAGGGVPSVDEVNQFLSEQFTDIDMDAVKSWFHNNRQRDWKTKDGRPIRDWKKALCAYVQAYQPPSPAMNEGDLSQWAEAQGISPDAFYEWVEHGERNHWKRINPVTGVEEVIFDFKASLLAFVKPWRVA